MIQLKNVNFAYRGQENVFEDFNWEVVQNENWAVLGPSGCGKSSLLYLLAGLRFPQSGEVWVGGQQLTRPRPKTGLILQNFGLLPWATVFQNVALGIRLRCFYGPDGTHAPEDEDISQEQVESRAMEWLQQLGLEKIADKYPSQISGGQRQRTAIARTLTLSPDLLLMDEPFASLDAPTRDSLQQLVLQLHREHALTIVTVTHSIEEAAILGRKILLLRGIPNHQPEVFENPAGGKHGFRGSEAYFRICGELHRALEETV
jgi:NitT/TauT family transport system ATP-binding protein